MKISRRDFNRCGLGALSLAAIGTSAIAGPEHLLRKPIPSSGETVPVVGLGTNRYGVGDDAAKRVVLKQALARFHTLGGTVIDTAPMYRSSEAVLGDLIADLGIRDDLFIATKVDEKDGGDATHAQIEESLRRLKTDTLDLVQVHNLIAWQDALPVLREWKQDGTVRYVGITTSRARQYGEFEEIMRREDLDFIQINYSLEQREAAERILPVAADRGMAVMINRPFGGGRIFEKIGDKPLPEWARDFGCNSWAQFLLNYALGHPAATLSIPGMTKVRHVDDNFGAAHSMLPDAAQRKRQEAFFDAL